MTSTQREFPRSAVRAHQAAGQTPLPTRPFPGVLFFAVLLVTVGRGAIQLVVGQSLAYVLQTAAVAAFILLLTVRGSSRASRLSRISIFLLGSFIVVGVLSATASLWLNNIQFGLLLTGVMGFVACLLAGAAGRDFQWTRTDRAGRAVVAVVWIQVVVATTQQVLGDRTFPGSAHTVNIIRPAALTGSYLHYPIELALLSLALLGMYAARRRCYYLATALVGMGAVILSQGRSGMVLVLAGLAIGTVFLPTIGGRLKIIAAAILALLTLLLLFPHNDFVSRFLSIGVVEGSVNEIRVGIWSDVLVTWSEGPLLIGSHTGEFTNVTNRLADLDKAGVTESGVLALLVNFGVLGLVTFYGLMFLAASASPRRSWYQAALLAGILQSFVYQSVEVLPFMVVFAMIPLIGRAFDADASDVHHSADEGPPQRVISGAPNLRT